MMRLDEVADFFETEIVDEDVDTIGGLVLKLLGRIAQVNDTVEIDGLIFNVNEVDGARITKLVLVKKVPAEPEEIEKEV